MGRSPISAHDAAHPEDKPDHKGKLINRLEVAWASWQALTKHEPAQFLILFFGGSCPAARGGGRQQSTGGPKLSLSELTLTEADIEPGSGGYRSGKARWCALPGGGQLAGHPRKRMGGPER